MEKISVIVPVYNVEKYLSQCLDSLVNQTFEDLKIIVVNDGSTDGSQLIIDDYQQRYPHRILAVSKANGGLASARNYGLTFANGEYIGFIDSDDYIELTMYEKLYALAVQDHADLVVCDLEYFFENEVHETFISDGLNIEWNENQQKAAMLSPLFAWNKLYCRKLFTENNLNYPLGLWYEDIPVSIKIFTKAVKISWVHETLVHYRQRENSIMQSVYKPQMHDIFKSLRLMADQLKIDGLYENYHDEIEYLFVEHCLYYGAFRFLRCSGYKALLKEGIQLVKEYFPAWRKNKYLNKLSFKNYCFIRTISLKTAPFYHWYLGWK
ncbi:MAG: glycosyltransferase [Erysipelotrichaceae bacterium]|nr:glycosyltransferase [Erysipelotrichaceae bacterium]